MAAPIDLAQARRIVLENAQRLGGEAVALGDALGRVLGEDVRSLAPVPSFDSSAMDGYAVRHQDVRLAAPASPARLSIVDESRAGRPALRAVGDGEAIAISTGAALPTGADTVVAVEQTRREYGRVEILAATTACANVRTAGEDIAAGETVLTTGTRLGPAELGVLASLGLAEASCARRPRLALVTTGDELTAPGQALGAGAIYNSNEPAIAALARLAGAEIAKCATVGDDRAATAAAIAAALKDADVVILCGGVSVGEHDHVRQALAELGAEERFWGVALKPGKPTLFATRRGTLVFGLPGNPVSAMVTFVLFVVPALRALSGAATTRRRSTATLTSDHAKSPGRAHAVRCRLSLGADGWLAEPTGAQGSHVLSSMLGAEALAIVPADSGSLAAGARVEIELLDEIWPVGA